MNKLLLKYIVLLPILALTIWIYYHYKFNEAFADAPAAPSDTVTGTVPPTGQPTPTQATPDAPPTTIISPSDTSAAPAPQLTTVSELGSTPQASSQAPLQKANDVGLFDDNTSIPASVQGYIQKSIASMVPAMMENFSPYPF